MIGETFFTRPPRRRHNAHATYCTYSAVALPNDKAAPAQPQMETIHFLAAHHDLSSIACATRTRMGTNVWFHLLDQGTTVLRHGLLSTLSIHVSMVMEFKNKAPKLS